MSVFKMLFKTTLVLALLFSALVLPVLLWLYAPSYLALYLLFSGVAGILFGAYLVSRAMPPEYKISWLFPALLVPFFGIALFLFFGNSRFGLKNDRTYTKQSLGLDAFLPPSAGGDGLFYDVAHTVFCETGYPAADGSAEYFSTGEAFFRAVFRAVERAEQFIFIEFFVVKPGALWRAFSDLLIKKAGEGVEIRFVLDDVGCLGGIRPRDCRRLRDAGVQLYYFNPVYRLDGANNRTHRKIVVADGTAGFLCGANIADEYVKGSGKFGYWKDAGVGLSGACVRNLTVMFLQIWAMRHGAEDCARFFPPVPEQNETIQVFSDSPVQSNAATEHLFLALVHGAQREIAFSTPYLLLDDKLKSALIGAVKRGVRVKIVIPAVPDKAAIYALTKQNADRLIAGGAEVYIYTPGFNHAKLFVADGSYAVVGTTNMDFRSFYLHFECNAFFSGAAAKAVYGDLREMIAASERAREKDFSAAGIGKLGRGILQIFQPLL